MFVTAGSVDDEGPQAFSPPARAAGWSSSARAAAQRARPLTSSGVQQDFRAVVTTGAYWLVCGNTFASRVPREVRGALPQDQLAAARGRVSALSQGAAQTVTKLSGATQKAPWATAPETKAL